MARVQVELPSQFIYETTIAVRVSDLNYGNHLAHDAIITIMQEARVSFYRSLGFKDEISFEGPVGQIIADVCVQYKSESFLGDILNIKIGISDVGKYGFDMCYLLVKEGAGTEVARGKTGIVCFDYSKKKIALIPEILKQKLQINIE